MGQNQVYICLNTDFLLQHPAICYAVSMQHQNGPFIFSFIKAQVPQAMGPHKFLNVIFINKLCGRLNNGLPKDIHILILNQNQ